MNEHQHSSCSCRSNSLRREVMREAISQADRQAEVKKVLQGRSPNPQQYVRTTPPKRSIWMKIVDMYYAVFYPSCH